MKEYDHGKIERKWQKEWVKKKVYKTIDPSARAGNSKREKFYILDMFPYPSGEGLHVGHPKGYIATDIYSRFKRMNGFSVLHPMGFDAFGLPAENYALKTKTNPADSVKENVKKFKAQLELIGLDYDWTREINTTDPAYYKWTQWIFLQLFKAGLAYESNEPINWCPSCKTGLANEDVEDGKCERCGTQVEKKPLRQWVLKITDYAEKLLEGLKELDWPESIKELQKNWIGKSEGSEIKFKVESSKLKVGEVEVFTTRADTLFGATYLVLAPEVANAKFKNQNGKSQFKIKNWEEVERYIQEATKRTEIERTAEGKEKTGVELKGLKAVNPANNEEIPVWVADYVLPDYGTGAIMAVPAHDERDWQFAKKYSLPIKKVLEPLFIDFIGESGRKAAHENDSFEERNAITAVVKHWVEDKYIILKWKHVAWSTFITGGIEKGETPEQAVIREIREETGFLNFEVVRNIGKSHSKFYHIPKKVNRFAHFDSFLLKLKDDAREEIGNEEKGIHEPVWIPAAEVSIILKEDSHQRYVWLESQNKIPVYTGEGVLTASGKFTGIDSRLARKEITKVAGGKIVTKYKLRDWVFSRQRYWGEPLPLIFCENCRQQVESGKLKVESEGERLNPGWFAVDEKELPLKLPKVAYYEPTGTGESPLAGISKWVNVKCPQCGGKGKRETNTMPQWAGSCWYYLAYIMRGISNLQSPISRYQKAFDTWLPVDFYVGGAEHATRHLIYARFWHKFLYDQKFVSTPEPFKKLQHVGLIMGEDGRKMSKRWGNVINPDEVIERFGADSLRVYEMFMGPFDQSISWNTDNLVGARRFIERVWNLSAKVSERSKEGGKEDVLLHQTIKKVSEDIENFKFNTAISQLMILTNHFEKMESVEPESFKALLILLAPFAPHLAEELWRQLGNKSSIHLERWISYKKEIIASAEVVLGVQVNGKVRGVIRVFSETTQEEALKRALEIPDIKKWVGEQKLKKIIYIPGKVLSILV